MRITALAGGIGGARFLRGLRRHLDSRSDGPHDLTVVANTGDDITLYGLRISPNVDTLLYTLGGRQQRAAGLGPRRRDVALQGELNAYGGEPQWFGLGERTGHPRRPDPLARAGCHRLQVTERLARRWGLPDQRITLLPMTDEAGRDPRGGRARGEQSAIHFQEWWIRSRRSCRRSGSSWPAWTAPRPRRECSTRSAEADLVILPPSNPVVSIGIILTVPGVRDALRGTSAPVVGDRARSSRRPRTRSRQRLPGAAGVEARRRGSPGLRRLPGRLADRRERLLHAARRRGAFVALLMKDATATDRMARTAVELALDLRR